jgi:hypothetical protein
MINLSLIILKIMNGIIHSGGIVNGKFDGAANSADSETMDSCFRRNDRVNNSVFSRYQEDKKMDACFRRNDRGDISMSDSFTYRFNNPKGLIPNLSDFF